VLQAFVNNSAAAAHAQSPVSNRFEVKSHKRVYRRNGKKTEDAVDYMYLRSEFIGNRLRAEWSSTNEAVHTIIYVTDFDPDAVRKPSGLLLTFIAMIPLDVPPAKREELESVMNAFMQDMVLFRVPK
jgi:hypothetical protein